MSSFYRLAIMGFNAGYTGSLKNSVGLYSDSLGTDIVKFEVGGANESEKVQFAVHRKILCNKIPVFKIMFMGGFLEASEQTATLPEDSPSAFRLLVSWIYTDRIATETPSANYYEELTELFFLSEKYQVITLMDRSIDGIIGHFKTSNCIWSPDTVKLAYENTHAKSKLRLFASRLVVYAIGNPDILAGTNDWSTENIQNLLASSSDLIGDVVQLLRGQLGSCAKDPRNLPACDYHQHGNGEVCPYGGKSSAI
ncbi:hypothetical protein OCU04_006625 [Sclerotinia nivalis]|uniref:BTB domain-containing protein n=1 Tax=Sclerotinia nivalis TaxID=352851 RepID=A0A9X0DIL2_9HELO|nr:hypothetical protein OCU04_006625 [Sclerotinia nivalis]